MELKLNEVNTSEKEVEVTYSYSEIKDDIEKEVKKRARNIQIPGFRKGKAPLQYIKKIYGDALEYEASEKVANTKFWEIAKEKDINPIDTPVIVDIKYEPQSDFFFKIRYEVMPVMDAKNYKDIEIELPEMNISDDDINHELKHVLNSHRELKDTDVVGDSGEEIITVDLVRIDESNTEIEGTFTEKLQIDLSNEKVQPEIIENSKGKKAGETFSFTFNDERMVKNLKGEEEKVEEKYTYRAEIKEIKKIQLPELDEEFLKKHFGEKITNEQELKDEIRKNLQNYLDKQIQDLHRSKLIETILENNPFEPPHSMVHRYLDQILKIEEDRAKQQKKPFDRHEMSHKLHSVAEFELKWHMIKENIKEKENISVTDDELQESAQKESERTGITVDKLLNYYNSSGFKNNLADQKLFDFLKNNNSVKFVEPKRRDNE